jgi:hypothetical protein
MKRTIPIMQYETETASRLRAPLLFLGLHVLMRARDVDDQVSDALEATTEIVSLNPDQDRPGYCYLDLDCDGEVLCDYVLNTAGYLLSKVDHAACGYLLEAHNWDIGLAELLM